MKPWMRYAIAAFVVAHGFVYLKAARSVLPVFEGWSGRSWLLGGAVTGDALTKLCLALWAVAGIGIVATGIALAFAFFAQALWRPLAIAVSAAGILGFFAFWDGRMERLLAQGVIGAVLSTVILAGAIWLTQVPVAGR